MANTQKTKKLKIVGNAFVITSKLKLDTIKKVNKFNKNLLCITESKDDEVCELFRIDLGKTGTISKYGITFATANTEGYATVTGSIPEHTAYDKRKEYVVEEFGTALMLLNDLEDAIETAVAEIDAAYAKLDEEIEEC